MAMDQKTLGNRKIEALHAKFDRLGIRGFWQPKAERPSIKRALWRWDDIYPLLMEAADVIDLGGDTARRFVALQTQSQIFSYGFQIVMPGESAEAHRHSPSALRFVVEGNGAYTTSNGQPMKMEPRDLLTQPKWVWHDHNNPTKEPIIWIDSLDNGLMRALEAWYFEPWNDGKTQPLTRPPNYSALLFGTVRPPEENNEAVPFHYKWHEVEQSLLCLAEQGTADPYDGILLEYKNPITGGPTLRNLTCYVQLIRPGEKTHLHRHTGTWVYHVVEGEGTTFFGLDGSDSLSWRTKDTFVVPGWEWHSHSNISDKPTYLFSVSDRPIIDAAGVYREEKALE